MQHFVSALSTEVFFSGTLGELLSDRNGNGKCVDGLEIVVKEPKCWSWIELQPWSSFPKRLGELISDPDRNAKSVNNPIIIVEE